MVNMRGVKDPASAFMVPTFLFVGTLLATDRCGRVSRRSRRAGIRCPVAPPPPALPATMQYLGIWLLLKAFSSGCAAMTGVEAVSNGVTAFKEPRAKKAN